jgi:multidrug efflux system outer membrane protein
MYNGIGALRLAPLALLVAGCTMAPQYEQPAPPVSEGWTDPSASKSDIAAAASPVADLGWHEFFNDARLESIVTLALENNRDLRLAVLNMQEVRALYAVQRADLFPSVNAAANETRGRTPADLSLPGAALTASAYSVGLGTSAYEIDFVGRVRSIRTSALEHYLASEEAQKSAQLSLVSAVANQYFTERANEEQRLIAQQTLASLSTAYALTKRRFDVGNVSELDLRTAETQVQTARANLALYVEAQARAQNALVLLVGCPLPATLPPPVALASKHLIEDLPAGIPSEVLTRRPDILQAEHELKAANASIGAARAAFFPSIRLTAFGGTSSADLDRLFKAGSGTWSFVPEITLPIFAGGRNRANLDVAKIEKQIEIARYEKAIQTAFREVADELVSRDTVNEVLDAQAGRVKAEEQRYALANQRYEQGVDSYVVLLTAQRDLYSAQQLLVQAQQARLTNLINLYKALGGGWRERTIAQEALAKAPAG